MAKLNKKNIKNQPIVMKVKNVGITFKKHYNVSAKDAFVNLFRQNRIPKDTFQGLNDINFEIRKGEAVGVIGYNGSGKSTLLKCISGVQTPDTGSITMAGKLAGLLEVGAGFSNELTGKENIYLNGAILGMTKEEIDSKYDDIVEFSEIEDFIDTEVKYYSSGMYVRLAFSIAIHTECDIFLADEVLAVGDKVFRKKCMQKIHEIINSGKTIFFVSHSEEQVKEICTRVIWLHKGELVADGTPDEVFILMNRQKDKNYKPPKGLELLGKPRHNFFFKQTNAETCISLTIEKKYVTSIKYYNKTLYPLKNEKVPVKDTPYSGNHIAIVCYGNDEKFIGCLYNDEPFV
jgi:ABC-2 type transport system ATP-binding protein